MAKPEAHEVNPSRHMLRVIQEKLSQEVRAFAADGHNIEIQKLLETAVNKLKKLSFKDRLDCWRSMCYILDGDGSPRFYHDHAPKKNTEIITEKKRSKKNKKTMHYAIRPRKYHCSQYLVDNINAFGNYGGFEAIFTTLKKKRKLTFKKFF